MSPLVRATQLLQQAGGIDVVTPATLVERFIANVRGRTWDSILD